MSIKKSLENLVTVLGGTPTEKTVRGLLGEVSVALGGSGDGKSVREQIDNIVAAKGGPSPEPGGDTATVDSGVVGTSTVG